MYIYLILFFLLYLVGRYLFFSIPLREGNSDEDDVGSNVYDQLLSEDNNIVDNDDSNIVDNDKDYELPSMETINTQLNNLNTQSLSQENQIKYLYDDIKNLLGKDIKPQ